MTISHETLNQLSMRHLLAADALLETGSVTHAAELLGLTQSAVSHTLRGLREIFDDELFVRVGAEMVPTPRALALRVPLRRALSELERAVSAPVEFDPTTEERTFTLAMADSFALTFLPQLLAIVRAEAPLVNLDIRPPVTSRRGGAVEQGDADIELNVGVDVPTMRMRILDTIEFACIVREDHPDVGETLDLETYCALPHALLSPSGRGRGIVDDVLDQLGLARRVMLRIRFFMAAPVLVASSDLILTGPKQLLVAMAESAKLRVLDPPFEIEPSTIQLLWHPALHDEPAHRWLRDCCVRAIDAG